MGLKSPVAVAQKDAETGGAYHQVGLVIAIEVSDNDHARPVRDPVVHRRLESSVAVAEQDAYIPDASIKIYDCQIEPIVSVEVGHCNRNGILPSQSVQCRLERA